MSRCHPARACSPAAVGTSPCGRRELCVAVLRVSPCVKGVGAVPGVQGVAGVHVHAERGLVKLAIDLEPASRDEARAYVGEPPAEIAPLVDDTIAVAREVKATVNELDPARQRVDGKASGCLGLLLDFSSAMDDLSAELDAWDAYL